MVLSIRMGIETVQLVRQVRYSSRLFLLFVKEELVTEVFEFEDFIGRFLVYACLFFIFDFIEFANEFSLFYCVLFLGIVGVVVTFFVVFVMVVIQVVVAGLH